MSDSTPLNKKGLQKLRYGKISRTLDVLGLVIGSGQKALSYKIQSQLKNTSKENIALEILKKQIEVLADKLSHLKGGLMKIGQMLSVYGEYFLPPDINDTLKSLQAKSVPFDWDVLKKILLQNLGEDIFEKIQVESTALASASIGQVHRAKIINTKTQIILKIQYPNVDKAIDSDLVALKSVFKIAELFPNISHMELLFDEVESMLKQELDYINEMNWTNKYAKALQGDNRYIVPQIYSEFTSSKILAASYEDGIPVDSIDIQSLSQEQRNTLAMNMLELYFMELFRWGFVQTDPHLGNYKIRITNLNPQIILYDFGAVREFPKEFLENYRGLTKAAYQKDDQKVKYYAEKLRFIYSGDPEKLQSLFIEFCKLMVEPFTTEGTPFHNSAGEYDWSRTDLPKRITQMVSEVIRNFSVRAPPREVVFLDRKTTGVFIFLSVLKAQIRGDDLLKKYLDPNSF